MRRERRNNWEIATVVLLAVFALLIVFTFRSYGVTVDEQHSIMNGKYFLDWYASGFRHRAIITEGNHALYGSFFNSIYSFFARHSRLGLYETGHLVIAITSFIGVVFVYRLGKKLGGPMAGFFSALILLLTPVYYGHSFMNAKDIPFAVMFLISLYYMIACYDRLPRLGFRCIAAIGVSIGLTLGIRVGALMLFGYGVVLIALKLFTQYRTTSSYRGQLIWTDVRSVTLSAVGIGILAWVVMMIWWPFAQVSPIVNPLRAMRRAANFTDYGSVVALYRGQFIPTDSLPWHYLPTWFAITLPEFYGLVLGLGVVVFVARQFSSRGGNEAVDVDRQSKILFLVFATLFPIVAAMVKRPILYDGNRHFLFVIPPLAVLTGVTLAWLLEKAVPRTFAMITAGVLVVIAGLTAMDMVRLHPYEYVFFNRTFGGLPHALGRYETDYWGVSHKEGVDWLIANYKPDAPKASIRVANTAADYQTDYYLRGDQPATERFVAVNKRNHPDVILSITRFDVHLRYPGKVLHVVRRMGVPLLYVTEVSQRN
jgi:hypothetical protein